MHAFPLVLLFAFAQVANCALDCQKELDVVENCMGEQLERIIPNTTTTSPEKLKDEIKQCFVDAGCHNPIDKKELEAQMSEVPPELLKRISSLQRGLGGLQLNTQMVDSVKECGLNLKEQLQPKLLACVRKHKGFENIQWPQGVDDEMAENDNSAAARFMRFVIARGDRLFKQKQHMAEVARAVYDDTVCATEEAREKAKKCISKAIDNTMPTEMKCLNAIDQEFLVMDKRTRVCKAHKGCMAKLPSECVKVVADMPKVTCQCSAEIVEKDFVKLIDNLQSCMENRSGESFGMIRNPIFSSMLQSVSSQAMRQICARLEEGIFDPCKSSTFSNFEHIAGNAPQQVQIQHIQVQQIGGLPGQQFAFPTQQQLGISGQQFSSFSAQQQPSSFSAQQLPSGFSALQLPSSFSAQQLPASIIFQSPQGK